MAIGALTVATALAGLVVLSMVVRRGFSARDQPSWIEATVATALRRLSIPREARERRNPIALTPKVLMDARAHFADHCAQCHANDGSGQTDMGRNLYPKPPDMRQRATQEKSDGELFYIIENGVRLTGMPAWGGTDGDEEESWALVSFIHQLPHLTDEDKRVMEYLNPKSPEEWQEAQEEDAFLKGAAPDSSHSHQHGDHR